MMRFPEAVFGLGCAIVVLAFVVLLAKSDHSANVITVTAWAAIIGTLISLMAFAMMHG